MEERGISVSLSLSLSLSLPVSFSLALCLTTWSQIFPAFKLELNLWLSWFSDLWIQTRITSLAFFMSPADWLQTMGLLGFYNCLSQFLVIQTDGQTDRWISYWCCFPGESWLIHPIIHSELSPSSYSVIRPHLFPSQHLSLPSITVLFTCLFSVSPIRACGPSQQGLCLHHEGHTHSAWARTLSKHSVILCGGKDARELPYTCVNTWYLFFSFWLTPLCMTESAFIHITTDDPMVFLFMAE